MAQLIAVQLETCHANTDGTAWYAYYDGLPSHFDETELAAASKTDGAPLGIEFDTGFEEVPSGLSDFANLRRFFVGSAV